jgi:CRP-like cAMP-binding protein
MPIATVLSREQRRIDAPQVQVEVDRNRHHKLDQQLCRWLLLSFLQGSDLLMTHELIANMLGVRREGVTEIAHKLQSAGLIRYHRGHISVVNRAGLEKRVCECYAVVKKEYDRLLPERSAR